MSVQQGPGPSESCLLVPVPEAEPAVGRLRGTFARTRWFGEDVLWLAPEPDQPFRALTTALHSAFPQCPPFGGIYPDVVPHLTIGDRPPGGPATLEAAEALRPRLTREVIAGLFEAAHRG